MRFLPCLLCVVLIWPICGSELHEAARVCEPERMKRLLAGGISVNEPDPIKMTALHKAVQAGKPICVDLLLKAGANKKLVDNRGWTPAQLALQIQEKKTRDLIVHMLLVADQEQPRAAMPWSLEYAALRGQTGVAAMLLKMKVDPNTIGTQGNTPLHDAGLKAQPEIVTLLLQHGAKVDLLSKSGTLPLHDAALGGNAEIIRELVAHGATLPAKTQETEETPLHIAAAWGKLDAIRTLLALGAPTEVKDKRGRTPLDAAIANGQQEAVALLRQGVRP